MPRPSSRSETWLQEYRCNQASGDGSIDLKAAFVVDGVGYIQACIQVKGHKADVGSPIIQGIRGSPGAHESGVVVTSGDFTNAARKEAPASDEAPIALVDGQMFVERLVKHKIGIGHVERKRDRLAFDDLDMDKLQALVEEAEPGEP